MTATAGLGALVAINLLLAFGYQWYAVVEFGAGRASDALFASLAVPVLTLSVIAESLTNVLVPVLAGLDRQQFRRVGWTVVHAVAGMFAVLALLLGTSAALWVPLLVPGFDDDARSVALTLTRIHLVGMVFAAVNAVAAATLYARGRFVQAEGALMAANIVALTALPWLATRYGIVGVAIALSMRPLVQSALLLPSLGSYTRPDWREPAARESWRRMVPLMVGSSYYKTDLLLDRLLASFAPAGGLTLLHVAQQLHGAANALLARSIAAPMVPVLTRAGNAGDWAGFGRLVRSRLALVVVLTFAAALALLVVGRPALGMAFEYRSFSEEQTRALWAVLLALTGMLVGGAAGQILASSFYAAHDVRTPTRIGMIGFTIGIFVKIAGFLSAGVLGLAVATSLYYVLNALLLGVALRRRTAGRPAPAPG